MMNKLLKITATAMLTTLCSCWSGCGCGDDQPVVDNSSAFDLATFQDVALDIVVDHDGTPRAGVAVSIETVQDMNVEAQQRETYYQGLTDANGRVTFTTRLPSSIKIVDVVVHEPGTTGPWTDTALQASLGPFAPSARVTSDVTNGVNLSISLTNG